MDKFTLEELRKQLEKQESYARTVTVRTVGVTAEDLGELSRQEEVELYIAGNPVNVKWVSTKKCGKGHLLGPDNAAIGVCQVASCNIVICSREGCSFVCGRCGKALCAAHAHPFKDGEVACPRCRIRGWFRRVFW